MWLSCNMDTCQWGDWASGPAAACTHGSGRGGQVAQLQHAHMAVGWLGRWLRCSMHTWHWDGWHAHTAMGWLGRWLSCIMHTCQWGGWVGGSAATCTHVSGMIGQVAQLQHAHMAAGWLGRWLRCSMHTCQWEGWACGLAAACTHGSGMVGQVAQLQHASMAAGMVGQVAQLQHAHMAVGWLGIWLSCSMHTRQWDGWAGGSVAACTHGRGIVG